jgi:hypothetical protein
MTEINISDAAAAAKIECTSACGCPKNRTHCYRTTSTAVQRSVVTVVVSRSDLGRRWPSRLVAMAEYRDDSRLSCSVGHRQLGPNARISTGRSHADVGHRVVPPAALQLQQIEEAARGIGQRIVIAKPATTMHWRPHSHRWCRRVPARCWLHVPSWCRGRAPRSVW